MKYRRHRPQTSVTSQVCLSRTSGSARPGSCVGGRSAGPGSTAGCSTPSVTQGLSGSGWGCAWPGPNNHCVRTFTSEISGGYLCRRILICFDTIFNSCDKSWMNLSELHQLLDLLVVEATVFSIVLTDEVLVVGGQSDRCDDREK